MSAPAPRSTRARWLPLAAFGVILALLAAGVWLVAVLAAAYFVLDSWKQVRAERRQRSR